VALGWLAGKQSAPYRFTLLEGLLTLLEKIPMHDSTSTSRSWSHLNGMHIAREYETDCWEPCSPRTYRAPDTSFGMFLTPGIDIVPENLALRVDLQAPGDTLGGYF
jgi:hypothetical protein